MYETLVLNLHDIGCKNKCIFCSPLKLPYVGKTIANKIAKEELKKLDYLKKNKNIQSIIISGNDPIEYHDLIGFLRNIKKITDIGVFFQSHCIDFENLDYLKEVLDVDVVRSIQVPIYGHNEKIHDSITQNPGSFKSIMMALENLKKMNFNNVQFNTLILKQNEDYIPELFSFLLKFGYKINASLPCIPSFNGKYLDRYLKNVPDLNKVSEGLKKVKDSMTNLDRISLIDIPFCIAHFGLNNTGFSNNLNHKAHKGYEHFKNKYTDILIIGKEVIPRYRILSKSELCKNCILDDRCFGITIPYVDLGHFKSKPLSQL